MPFRQSPYKRQKIYHVLDDDDEDESIKDSTTALGHFQTRPAPPTRNGLNGHGTFQASTQQASHRDSQPPVQSQSSRFPPFTNATLALLRGLRGLGNALTNTPTTEKKTKLTEEQDGPASIQPCNSTPAYGNDTRTLVSGSSPPKTPANRSLVVARDYPHGLPLPRPANSPQPTSPFGVRKTPIPLPTSSSARPSKVQNPPIPHRPRPAAVQAQTTRPLLVPPAATSTCAGIPSYVNPAPPLHPTGPPPVPHKNTAKPPRHPPWSEEEDSLIIYLKHGLEWSFKQVASVLTGRSQGAANTRYCNHLKYGYDMKKAIEVVQKSRWAHVLRPERHAEILARDVLQAPPSLAELDIDVPALTGQHSSTPGATIATQRERRAAQRPTNYYTKDHYAEVLDEDVVMTELGSAKEPQRSAHNAELVGTEIRGMNKRGRGLPGSRKTLRSSRPYLSYHERSTLQQGFEEGKWKELNEWNGTKVHVPFTGEELKSLKQAIAAKFEDTSEHILYELTEPEILEVASYGRNFLLTRTKESIEAFLRDVADNRQSKEVLRLSGQRRVPSISAVMRNREMGVRTTRTDYSKRNGTIHLQTSAFDTIGPSLSFTGTSGDVNTVAWAPCGTQFAAGSACLVDSDSMQYNRPNNLLFGDVSRRTLYELPDHFTRRKMPKSGVNSSRSMHVTQDPRLFQTVSMVAFSLDGSLMYSAGYDKKVRIYDITDNGVPEGSDVALRHRAKVDLLAVSAQGLLATGCQRSRQNSIKVVDPFEAIEHCHEDFNPVMHNFSSRKAAERPENCIFPSALRFDPTGDFLLAGFASTSREEMTSGETCLWDVRTGEQLTIIPETRNVFDVAWNPSCWYRPLFAVGCMAGTNVNRGIRSVIKMYDYRLPGRYGLSMELDCPALDMNDVLYCPYDENLIVAGCTNGKTYVWDFRRPQPEYHLYSLVHSEPLMQLGDDDPASRERLDTGIRFCSWGHDRRKFFTGSSDGVVKAWDPYRAPEDVFVKDIVQLNSGVMSGAFGPDHTSLLLGEVNGTINVLEVGQYDRSIKEMDSFDLIASEKSPGTFEDEAEDHGQREGARQQHQAVEAEDDGKDSGVAAARHLLETDQMMLRSMGSLPIRQAVQGPNYAGPFDKTDDADRLRKAALVFQRKLSGGPPMRQCDIPACRDNANKFVPEEAGDSGRSADRIPGVLRCLGRKNVEERQQNRTTIEPSLKCSKCRIRPARPRLDDDNGDGHADTDKPLCERCGFSCMRCGRPAEIILKGRAAEEVRCPSCELRWRADVLGYELVPERRVSAGGEGREKAKMRETVVEVERRSGHDYLAADGEECVEEYYHGLWQDRPASPL